MKKFFYSCAAIAATLLIAFNADAQNWSLTGNAGTDTATNFIGTTDSKGIKFKANNLTRMYIDKGGRVGIGTSNPQTLLDVYSEKSAAALGIRSDSGNAFFFIDKKHVGDNSTVSYRTAGNAKWQTGTFGNNDFAIKNLSTGSNSLVIDLSTNAIGMGVTPSAGYKLTVGGKVICTEVQVQTMPFPDYVFDASYNLKSIEEVEQHINTHKRLPGMPSACEVEANGMSVGKMQTLTVEKVEEMMLYIIQLKKENEQLQKRIESLEKK